MSSALDHVIAENKQLKDRLATILELLNAGFDLHELRYDTQAVNQAHRVAAGGEAPRRTKLDEKDSAYRQVLAAIACGGETLVKMEVVDPERWDLRQAAAVEPQPPTVEPKS